MNWTTIVFIILFAYILVGLALQVMIWKQDKNKQLVIDILVYYDKDIEDAKKWPYLSMFVWPWLVYAWRKLR